MLDLYTRTAILRMSKEGHGSIKIAKTLGLSRNAVRKVIRSGQVEVPGLERDEMLTGSLELVRALYDDCRGNLVRVGEKLADAGINVGYSTLTSFCRRHDIGTTPKQAFGAYSFAPGEEMQHDTSPHTVPIAGKMVTLQCASLVMCYSRDLYAQVYRRWSRFECRMFLSEGIAHFGGAAHRCVVDNLTVIIAHGLGREAVPAPEMQALATRFGFTFMAHEPGDKNRSGRVERPSTTSRTTSTWVASSRAWTTSTSSFAPGARRCAAKPSATCRTRRPSCLPPRSPPLCRCRRTYPRSTKCTSAGLASKATSRSTPTATPCQNADQPSRPGT